MSHLIKAPEYDNHKGYWKEAGIIQCVCGHKIEFFPAFTVTCEQCERDYNSSGALLVQREYWGEETGEDYLDIVNETDHYEG